MHGGSDLMAKVSFRGKAVEVTEDVDMDKLLEKLPIDLRGKAVREAVKQNVMLVAREYRGRIPKGPTGNLKKSVRWMVIPYQDGRLFFGIAGHIKPTGNHAHLINLGHDVWARGPIGASAEDQKIKPESGTARVPGKRYLHKAIITTRKEREKVMIDSIVKSIKEAGG